MHPVVKGQDEDDAQDGKGDGRHENLAQQCFHDGIAGDFHQLPGRPVFELRTD